MLAEYHLFRTKPLEKCFFEKETVVDTDSILEALHVIGGLRSRIANLVQKMRIPIQGYAFVDRVPAVLIRADGTIFLFERYLDNREKILKALETIPLQGGICTRQFQPIQGKPRIATS
jgi:hypothetical protein